MTNYTALQKLAENMLRAETTACTIQEAMTLLSAHWHRYGDMRLALGFDTPHSYRGVYAWLAVQPSCNVDLHDMLTDLQQGLRCLHTGYKGGEYRMTPETPLYLARYGQTGIPMTEPLLQALLTLRYEDELL